MKYIQDPDTLELVPADQYTKRRSGVSSFNIMPDIKPYWSPVSWEYITSRSEHRRHKREYNLVEVGNEKPDWMKE